MCTDLNLWMWPDQSNELSLNAALDLELQLWQHMGGALTLQVSDSQNHDENGENATLNVFLASSRVPLMNGLGSSPEKDNVCMTEEVAC